MVFKGVTSVRMKDRIQPATRFPVPIAFITLSLLLGLALCAQGGDGFGVGVYHENIRTGSQDMGLKFKRGSELDHKKSIHRRGTYYDPTTELCVCDALRNFPVMGSLPEAQRPGYCVVICGAPIEGVQSADPATSTTTVAVETSTEATSTQAFTSSSAVSVASEIPAAPLPPTPPAAPTPPTPPVAPTAPTPPAAPTPPQAPEAPTTPTQSPGPGGGDNPVNIDGDGSGQGPVNNGNSKVGEDNTGLKIGVGVAVGVFSSALVAFFFLIFLRKRSERRRQDDGITFGCVGDQSDVHPALRTEKYIYSAPTNDSKHAIHSKQPRTSPPSPQSVPPAYSAPTGGVIPSSTNTSSTSLDTNPPFLPLGAPSRVLDLAGGSRSQFVPGNLNNKNTQKVSAKSPSVPVQPPSVTFFLHPVKNDTDLEEDERKWLNEEHRRIRAKKEAVEELNKLREEEDKIREKIRERLSRDMGR